MAKSDDPHPDRIALAALERIDGVCAEFERQWKSGKAPQIEQFLAGFAGAEASLLLKQLLLLEIEYRKRRNEGCSADAYRERFRDLAAVVDAAFAEMKRNESPARQPNRTRTNAANRDSSRRAKPLADFVKSLTDSGLMSADEVSAFQDSLGESPAGIKSLARALVAQKKLTAYQAQSVYQNRTAHLVMGEYVVLDKIGEGGMGQVLKAGPSSMERVVVIQMMLNCSMD